jgi:hypothetical protein
MLNPGAGAMRRKLPLRSLQEASESPYVAHQPFHLRFFLQIERVIGL